MELDTKSDQLIPVNKTPNIECRNVFASVVRFLASWQTHTQHLLSFHVRFLDADFYRFAQLRSAQVSSLFIYHVFVNLIKNSFEMLELALIVFFSSSNGLRNRSFARSLASL